MVSHDLLVNIDQLIFIQVSQAEKQNKDIAF